MKVSILKYHILLILLLLNGVVAGQTVQDTYLDSDIEERAINKEQWQKAIEGISYDEQPEKKEAEDYDEGYMPSASDEGRSGRSYPSGSGDTSFWGSFFKVMLVLILIAVIALLAAHFMGAGAFNNPINRKFAKSDTMITVDNIEDYIHESDLDRFIRESVEEKNYALAIRLYYLAIIKELSLKRAIQWKKDKTNKDYLREMRKTDLFQSFREATRLFERVWYGEEYLSQSDYERIKPQFEALVKAAQDQQLRVNVG